MCQEELSIKIQICIVIDSASVLIELLEISIHCILYARKIYPEGIFELKKKYNVPVHVSIFFLIIKKFYMYFINYST